MDETYVRVKGKWVYLYRAVDSSGATLDFLLSEQRDAAAAKRFLEQSIGHSLLHLTAALVIQALTILPVNSSNCASSSASHPVRALG